MRRLLLSILIGLLIGAAIGLTLGWVVMPVQYVDSPMHELSDRYKDEYTVLVAAAFQVDGDVNAAVQRISPLGVSNVFTYVRDVTERTISQRGVGRETDIRHLVALSCAMGYCTEFMQPFLAPAPTLPPGQ